MDSDPAPGIDRHDIEEVTLVARGIATAVAPESGLTDVQAELLEAIASALTGISVDYRALAPLGPQEFADCLAGSDLGYRRRIVHHMVLGELVLRPIPVVVAHRVATYAEALGVKDDFVRVARRYAQGAYGLAWMAGVLGKVGLVIGATTLVGVSDASRLLLPTDALWQGVVFGLEPSFVINAAEGQFVARASPFFAASGPPPVIVAWSVVWVVAVLALAVVQLRRREL